MDRNDVATRLVFVFAAFWFALALVLALTGAASYGQRLGLVVAGIAVTALGVYLPRLSKRERGGE